MSSFYKGAIVSIKELFIRKSLTEVSLKDNGAVKGIALIFVFEKFFQR